MFKEKSSKKRIVTAQNSKDAATLDARHQQMLQQLSDNHAKIAELRAEHERLTTSLADTVQTINARCAEGNTGDAEYDQLWTTRMLTEDKIQALNEQIDRLERCQDEIDYYNKTADILFKYYDIVDNEKTQGNFVSAPLPKPIPKGRKKTVPLASKNILEALNLIPPKPAPEDTPNAAPAPVQKSTLVDDYLSVVDPTYVRQVHNEHEDRCPTCKIQLTCLQQEGISLCDKCGFQELLLVEQNRPIIRTPSNKEASHMSYKRINHFREWCSQIQGKESTDIPEEIYEKILAEIKKERISDPKQITHKRMREILKKMHLNRYYEHITYITMRISGTSPPNFSQELEEKLCEMFKQIQPLFLKYCPKDRKNFLSYSYVLSKFFQILGLHENTKYLQSLKARDKLYLHDEIFGKICKELGWPMIPTI